MIMKRLLAETFGTFALVFAGTGAIVINAATDGGIGHAGIALTFGLIVMAMIYTVGDVSGAHLNPAVTLGFAVARRFSWREVPGYRCGAGDGSVRRERPVAAALSQRRHLPWCHAAGRFRGTELRSRTGADGLLMMCILSVSSGARRKGSPPGSRSER